MKKVKPLHVRHVLNLFTICSLHVHNMSTTVTALISGPNISYRYTTVTTLISGPNISYRYTTVTTLISGSNISYRYTTVTTLISGSKSYQLEMVIKVVGLGEY